jgi:zinc transport system ATP-binding protein
VNARHALAVERLTVRFGRKVVLRDLTFTVSEGGTLAVIGPNGSGKTILLKALIGSVGHEGEIRWADGVRVGYVPQKLDLERDLPVTGRDFLHAKAVVSGAGERDAARVCGLVGLAPAVVAQPIGTLSGGQFQRLLLAFALMGRPTVLLFDEPTAGVDEPGEEGLYAMLSRLQDEERFALVLISHELSLVYRYADNVLCLGRNLRFCSGPPLEVLTPERLQEMYGTPMRFHAHNGELA